MNRTNWWHKAIYVIAVVLLTEGCLQTFYRLTTGSYLISRDTPPIYSSDPVSGWTNTPSLSYRHVTPEFIADIYTNSQGFRVSSHHEEYEHPRPGNIFRILLLGPSFAFGWGVNYEDTFGAQLQETLAKTGIANGTRVEVLNHGVPYQSPANGLDWFKARGKDYGPNLVIQFIYGSLEVEAVPDTSITVSDGHIILKASGMGAQIWSYAKMSATVFYSGVIVGLIHKSLYHEDSIERIDGAGRHMRNSRGFELDDLPVKRSLVFYENLKRTVEETGARLLLVYFPLAYIVHPEDRTRWALHGVENIDSQIEFNQMFASYLNENGIRCLNLTEFFIDAAREGNGRLYYWLDIHWTKLGNVVAAKSVTQYLAEQSSLLPEPEMRVIKQVSTAPVSTQ